MHVIAQDPQPWYQGIDLRQHTTIRRLGRGGFGVVTLAAVEVPDGGTQHMAVKSLLPFTHKHPDMPEDPEDLQHLQRTARREVEGMKVMQGSPHAIEFYGSSLDYVSGEELSAPQQEYQLYMEVAKGTLEDELVSGLRSWICLEPRTQAYTWLEMPSPAALTPVMTARVSAL